MQDGQIPGYEDFLDYYDRIQQILQNRNRDGQETRLFAQYVSQCYAYGRSLSPYEFQLLCEAQPEMEEKMEVVSGLHEKIRLAIREAFRETAPKGSSES